MRGVEIAAGAERLSTERPSPLDEECQTELLADSISVAVIKLDR